MNEGETEIEKIKDKIHGNRLVISNVPKNTLIRFKEIASDEDFMEHYGFTLKYLVDFHDGIIQSGVEHIEGEVQLLKEEVEGLKQKPTEKKHRTMMDGKKMEEKENE